MSPENVYVSDIDFAAPERDPWHVREGEISRLHDARVNLARFSSDSWAEFLDWDTRAGDLVDSLIDLLKNDKHAVSFVANELYQMCAIGEGNWTISETISMCMLGHLDVIGRSIPHDDLKVAGHLLSVCNYVHASCPAFAAEAAEIISKNVNVVKEGLKNEKLQGSFLETAAGLVSALDYYEGCYDATKQTKDFLKDLISSDELAPSQKIIIVAGLFRVSNGSLMVAIDMLDTFVDQYRLDGMELFSAWALNEEVDEVTDEEAGKAREEIVYGHLKAIVALEDKNPEICRKLYDTSGIRNFGFYPREVLEEQYEEIENSKKPYVAVVLGSCGAMDLKKWLSKFRGDLSSDYAIRISEVKSSFEAGRLVVKMKKHHNKAELVVIICHGFHEEGFSYLNIGGGTEMPPENPGKIDKSYSHLASKAVEAVCAPSAPIVVASCDIGKNEGVIQEFSSNINRDVWGSTQHVFMGDVYIKADNPFEVKPDLSVGTVRYRGGKVVD